MMTAQQHSRAIKETRILRREAKRIATAIIPGEDTAPDIGIPIEFVRAAQAEAYDLALLALIDGVMPEAVQSRLEKHFDITHTPDHTKGDENKTDQHGRILRQGEPKTPVHSKRP